MTQFDSTTRTILAPGQALRLQLDRRITLVVVKGAVMVIGPSLWLGERMLAGQTQMQMQLQEGQAFRLSTDGWTEVIALGEAPVELVRYGQAGATLQIPWRWRRPRWFSCLNACAHFAAFRSRWRSSLRRWLR